MWQNASRKSKSLPVSLGPTIPHEPEDTDPSDQYAERTTKKIPEADAWYVSEIVYRDSDVIAEREGWQDLQVTGGVVVVHLNGGPDRTTLFALFGFSKVKEAELGQQMEILLTRVQLRKIAAQVHVYSTPNSTQVKKDRFWGNKFVKGKGGQVTFVCVCSFTNTCSICFRKFSTMTVGLVLSFPFRLTKMVVVKSAMSHTVSQLMPFWRLMWLKLAAPWMPAPLSKRDGKVNFE